MQRTAGIALVAIGLTVAIVGVVVWAGGFSWFGRLPGDIRIEGERSRVYVPIVSMLLVSVVLTIVVNLVGRFLR